MAFARVGSAPTIARAAAASVATTWATGQTPAAGHLLVLFASSQSANTIDTPAGWTSSGSDVLSSQTRCNLFYKQAAGSDTAPTISSTGASKCVGFVDEFSGWDLAAPSLRGTNTATSGSTLAVTLSSNPPKDGIALTCYAIHNSASNTATETAGAGFTQDAFGLTSSDNLHAGGDYQISPSQGSATSETITVTTTALDRFVGLIIFFGASGGAAVNANFLSMM